MTDLPPTRSISSTLLLQGIATATNRLLTAQSNQDSVQMAIDALGQSTDVDRIYIFENHPHTNTGQPAASQRWEWVAAGITPEINNPELQDMLYSEAIPRWYPTLCQQAAIAGLIKDFPENEQELLSPQGILSILVVPIFIRENFWGFIGFDDCHQERLWTVNEQAALIAIAGTIGGAISQRRSEAQLKQLNEQLEQRVQARTIELQKAKEKAEIANRAKSDFLASMSHELRTPLNGILGYAQILGRDRQATPQQKAGVAIINQCGTHLLNLINDVLDLAKIEARKLELSPKVFDFEAFLKGVVDISRIEAEQKEISFVYEPLNSLPQVVQADEKRLRQVLLNLLGNAIKFTDQGQVTLKVNQLESLSSKVNLRFEVEDTGIGMSPEQLAKIFQPFEQVGTDEHKAEGTGLGLAISRQIVEMMGSLLHVESVPAEGSSFWFELELEILEDWQPATTTQPTQTVVGYVGDRRKILVVDDRWENRAVIINLLEPLGFELHEAEDGEAGLAIAQQCQPDLVLTDLVMPKLDGFEFTQALRNQPEFRDLPVIASSASVFNFDRQRSQAVGCNDFLPKPVQLEELLDQLQTHLQLQWQVEIPEALATASPQSVIAPPLEELVICRDALKIGDFDTMEVEGQRLAQLAPDYVSFGRHLQALAQDFDDDAIAQLISPSTPTVE